MSMKNANDTIWNRTSDLPICSTASIYIGQNVNRRKTRQKNSCASRKVRRRKWHKQTHQEGNYVHVTNELDCRSSLKDRY